LQWGTIYLLSGEASIFFCGEPSIDFPQLNPVHWFSSHLI